MVLLEFKLKGTSRQYQALDEAIGTTQFIRNKCVRLWQDTPRTTPADLNKYCRVLAQQYAFVRRLNSMARQAAAERAAAAITRFYKRCKDKKPGKKGYPRFQKDCRLVLGRDHNSARIILSRGLALLGPNLPPDMAESHAWGEETRYPGQVTGRGKAAR
jgi:transposase